MTGRYAPDTHQYRLGTSQGVRQRNAGVVHDVDAVRGLSVAQRAFLAVRMLYGTDGAAAEAVQVQPATVSDWHKYADFAVAYDSLWDEAAGYAQGEVRRLLGKAVQTLERGLDAVVPVFSAKSGEQVGERPDWQARTKSAELLLRAAGLYQTAPTQTGEVQPVADALAAIADMARLRRLEYEEHRAALASTSAASGVVVEGETVSSAPLSG